MLPEAQADRFMFSIHCGYPTNAGEELVVRNTTGNSVPDITSILDANAIVESFFDGLHRSPFLGYSTEFSAYRPYNTRRRYAAYRLEGLGPDG